jgi:hypothetical protein
LYHAAPQRWKRAAAWRDGRPTQARRGCGWARHRLRHGHPAGGLAARAEAVAVEGLPATARDTLRTGSASLERHRAHSDEAAGQALGFPLGSGMGDSACQWLIQQRCKGVGMRWSAEGFNQLLPWRLAWVHGSFAALLQMQVQASPNT